MLKTSLYGLATSNNRAWFLALQCTVYVQDICWPDYLPGWQNQGKKFKERGRSSKNIIHCEESECRGETSEFSFKNFKKQNWMHVG